MTTRSVILVFIIACALVIGNASARRNGKKSGSMRSSDGGDEDCAGFCKAGPRPSRRGLSEIRTTRGRRGNHARRESRRLRGDDDDDGGFGDDDDDGDAGASCGGGGDDDDDGGIIQFESGFFISYAGPAGESLSSFDTNDVLSIDFLQESIQFVYNGEIGCQDGGAQFDVTSVVLDNQIAVDLADEGTRKLQGNFGMGFTLSNFYKVFGNCRFCGPNPNLVNDGVERRLEAAFASRQLQENEIPEDTANFNREIVPQLNGRASFANIRGASITNDLPPEFAMQRTIDADPENSNDFMDDLDFSEEVP